jgi:hypothetical protein
VSARCGATDAQCAGMGMMRRRESIVVSARVIRFGEGVEDADASTDRERGGGREDGREAVRAVSVLDREEAREPGVVRCGTV